MDINSIISNNLSVQDAVSTKALKESLTYQEKLSLELIEALKNSGIGNKIDTTA